MSAKEIAAEVFLSDLGNRDLCGPFVDANDTLHVCLQNSAEIHSVSQTGQLKLVHSTQGQLSGGCCSADGTIYMADFAHTAVLKGGRDGEQGMVVGEYEDRPLKGPHSVVVRNNGSEIVFTDSGPVGETGLHDPTGSLFVIKADMLIPISLGNLAYPTGVATYGNFVYVCEQSMNRVLRFYQEPEGVYHGSVFYQSAGGVGPSCIAVDAQGSLYVGVYETSRAAAASSGKSSGSVLVLSDAGKLVSVITTEAPEVTGLCVNAKGTTLYITEKSTGSVYQVAL